MPIVLEYQPSAYALGNAAYAAGKNKYTEDRKKLLMPLIERQMQNDALMQQQQLEGAQRLALEASRFGNQSELLKQRGGQTAEQIDLRRDAQMDVAGLRAQNRLDVAGLQGQNRMDVAGLQGRNRLDVAGVQGQNQADVEILDGIRRGQLELPPSAQKRLSEINDEKARLKMDSRFNDDERSTLDTKLERERRSIWRSAVPTVKQKLTHDEEIKEGYRRTPGGHDMFRQQDGKWTQLRPNDTATKQENEQRKQQAAADKQTDADIRDAIRDLTTQNTVTKELTPPTQEQVIAAVNERRKIREALRGQGGTPGGAATISPQSPPAAAPSPAPAAPNPKPSTGVAPAATATGTPPPPPAAAPPARRVVAEPPSPDKYDFVGDEWRPRPGVNPTDTSYPGGAYVWTGTGWKSTEEGTVGPQVDSQPGVPSESFVAASASGRVPGQEGPVAVSSPDDIKRLGLKSGTRVLYNGREAWVP